MLTGETAVTNSGLQPERGGERATGMRLGAEDSSKEEENRCQRDEKEREREDEYIYIYRDATLHGARITLLSHVFFPHGYYASRAILG